MGDYGQEDFDYSAAYAQYLAQSSANAPQSYAQPQGQNIYGDPNQNYPSHDRNEGYNYYGGPPRPSDAPYGSQPPSGPYSGYDSYNMGPSQNYPGYSSSPPSRGSFGRGRGYSEGRGRGDFNRGRGRDAPTPAQEQPNDTIYITGIPPHASEQDLADLFGSIGIIKKDKRTGGLKITLYKDKETGAPKGDGTVTYDDPYTSNAAIEWFNDKEFMGSTLHVELAQKKEFSFPGGDRGRGRGGDRGRGRGRGGRPGMPGGDPGDWMCVMCSNMNFARRAQCNRCSTPRPGPSFGEPDSEPTEGGEFRDRGDRRDRDRDRDRRDDRRRDDRDDRRYGRDGRDGRDKYEERRGRRDRPY